MKTPRYHEEVLQLIFPKVRAEVLRVLFTCPKQRRYLSELARLSDVTIATMHEELAALSAVGIVSTRSTGKRRNERPEPRYYKPYPLRWGIISPDGK